jgi:Domain of unknown function(DUF2779)
MKLSKTTYLTWCDCPHNAWLKVRAPDVYSSDPLSAFDQTIIEAGNEVDVLARSLFPGGMLIPRDGFAETLDHISSRTPVLYQPVLATKSLVTACDILVWKGDRYDVYEVKASTSGEGKSAKNDLCVNDLGFQAHLLWLLDVPIGRLFLVRLNSDYVRRGTLDVAELFTCEDLTDRVSAVLPIIAAEVAAAHDDLSRGTPLPAPCKCITKGRSAHCTTFAHTNPEVPAYSVHDIARIGMSPKKLSTLIDQGILAVTDVPDDMALSAIQSNQVEVARSQQPIIDHNAIVAFLASIKEPIAFLDYETFAAALPRFEGYRPFDQIPFQFSLDVVEASKFNHHEFLFTENTNPDAAFISALEKSLPRLGSIIVWNKGFESSINKTLGQRNPTAQAMLIEVNARMIDLEVPFKRQMFVHPGFKGRTSIKMVLPTLVPTLSYNELAIQEGATASDTWNKVVSGARKAATVAQERKNLLAYCALDTRAMVEIWRALRVICSPSARHDECCQDILATARIWSQSRDPDI